MDNDSGKIYKRCYFIACAVILVDLIVKFNLMEWQDVDVKDHMCDALYMMIFHPLNFFKCDPHYIKWWIFFWVEATLLTFLFCFNLFAHAKKGVLLGVPKWDGKKFPWKKYLLISAIPSLVVAVCLWLRWMIPFNIVTAFKSGYALLFLGLILAVFIILFTILFVSFVIAYIIAKKTKKLVE